MSDQFNMDGAPSVRITKVEPTFGSAGPGQSARIMRVYFKVTNQPEQWIEVPLEEGWVERAKSEVIQHAADIVDLTSFNIGQ